MHLYLLIVLNIYVQTACKIKLCCFMSLIQCAMCQWFIIPSSEDCLIKRLTKINRMDIVHLIETQMNKSVQEQTSRTYAEIEKTLDHSEGSNIPTLLILISIQLVEHQALIHYVYVCSVSSAIFSARRCRQPKSSEKSGDRPPTTPSCFWRGPLSCFTSGYSLLGRASWAHTLGEHAWWPVGGAGNPTVNY